MTETIFSRQAWLFRLQRWLCPLGTSPSKEALACSFPYRLVDIHQQRLAKGTLSAAATRHDSFEQPGHFFWQLRRKNTPST